MLGAVAGEREFDWMSHLRQRVPDREDYIETDSDSEVCRLLLLSDIIRTYIHVAAFVAEGMVGPG